MFKVKSKSGERIRTVYGYKGEGRISFLFFVAGEWKWELSENWFPIT